MSFKLAQNIVPLRGERGPKSRLGCRNASDEIKDYGSKPAEQKLSIAPPQLELDHGENRLGIAKNIRSSSSEGRRKGGGLLVAAINCH